MVAIEDNVGAFVPGPRTERAPLGNGRLSGLSFAAKDLFDLAGVLTTFGNPDWASTHAPAIATAPVVLALLQAGARLAGKTKTQELAYGLTGENVWHGTPDQPGRAGPLSGWIELRFGRRGRGLPGGFCAGIGYRRLGAHPGELLRAVRHSPHARGDQPCGGLRVGAELRYLRLVRPLRIRAWPGSARCCWPVRARVPRGRCCDPEEAWVNADPGVAEALRPALEKLEQLRGRAVGVRIAPEGIDSFFDHFRTVQAEEAWAALGGWVEATQPRFGPGIAERFAAAKATDPAMAAPGRAFRRVLQARIRPLLSGGAVMVYPTSPCVAPLLTAGRDEQDAVRQATVGVTAIAGFCGLPEVTLPAAPGARCPGRAVAGRRSRAGPSPAGSGVRRRCRAGIAGLIARRASGNW